MTVKAIKIWILALLVLAVAVMPGVCCGADGDSETDEQVEELILRAYQDSAVADTLLAEALTRAEQMPGEKGVFYQAYIAQSRFRIEAAVIKQPATGEIVSESERGRITRTVAKLSESIAALEQVKVLLQKKNERLENGGSSYLRNQALISRCDFCNAWAWYSLSTIVTGPQKKQAIERADKLFTGFLAKKYNQQNMPVIVNCLYGKGLCLRDSGRYYDLITMLDSVDVDMSDAVKFARLRLAAAVELDFSLDILRVVQDYFEIDNSGARLKADELEMLLDCIAAASDLLKRQLPPDMKASLTEQLIKAVELTESYGENYRQRVFRITGGLDLKSAYIKLLQARSEVQAGANCDYEKVYSSTSEALTLSKPDVAADSARKRELLYLHAVSAWNLHKFTEAYQCADEFIKSWPTDQQSGQLAEIAANSIVKQVISDKDGFERYLALLDDYREKQLILGTDYNWYKGVLLVNAGRYKQGYDYFNDDKLELDQPEKKLYGKLLTVMPLLKDDTISGRQATDLVCKCCRLFLTDKSFVVEGYLQNTIFVACEVASHLISKGDIELTREILEAVRNIPDDRPEIAAKIFAYDLKCALLAGEDVSGLISTLTVMNYQNQPEVFNALVGLVSKFSDPERGFDEKLKITVYKILLSSSQLAGENILAIRMQLASCYFRTGNYKGFVDAYAAIQELARPYITPEIYRQLAIANQRLKLYDAAAQNWSMVQLNNVNMEQESQEALYNKVLCMYLSGQKEKARQVLALSLLRNELLGQDKRFIRLNEAIGRDDLTADVVAGLEWQAVEGVTDKQEQTGDEK